MIPERSFVSNQVEGVRKDNLCNNKIIRKLLIDVILTAQRGAYAKTVAVEQIFCPLSSCDPLVHVAPALLRTTVLSPSLSLVEPLVELNSTPLDQTGTDNGSNTAEENQTTSKAVEGLLAGGEKVWAEPMASLRNAVCDGNQRGLLTTGRRDKRRLPRQLQVKA